MRRFVGFAAALAVAVGGAAAVPAQAGVPATVSPIADRTASGVTADALPTAQVNGVVWSQAIAGDTVYAGGEFTQARPAGAPLGTDESPRSNLLAYTLSTGKLIADFAPVVNGPIKTVVASPDGTRIYIGGNFTSVDGVARNRIAAFDTATGALTSFAPTLDATVNSISATNTTVYAGGIFSTSNGAARSRLAAFSASTGALLNWAPTANDRVNAVQLTPDGTHLIVGGAFTAVNGSTVYGLTSIDTTTGAMSAFNVNQVVQDYGDKSAILSLSTDGTAIYGTGYTYGSPGNFEGTFSADPSTGTINWLEDCHGDTYGSYASGGEVYVISHEHYCGNIGGFPDTNPRNRWTRTSAFTTQATGTVQPNASGSYASFAGQPSPSLVNWFPTLTAGTYTQQDQAAWTVTGNGQYVVEGGEFPSVNGTPQQGLVRFAVHSIAPDKRGPADNTGVVTALPTSDTSATISWPANWDQDDQTLTYKLLYTGTSTPIYTVTQQSQFWNRPTLTYTDLSLTPHQTYTYKVVVSDPDGNSLTTYSQSITPGGPPAPTTTTVANVTPTSAVVGQPVTADVSVLRSDNTPITGSVDVSAGGGPVQTLTLASNGHAQLTTSFATPGQQVITATFKGDTANTASAGSSAPVTVTQASTRTAATVTPANPVAGQKLSVASTVAAVSPATGTPTGSVSVAVDGTAAASTTLAKAKAKTSLPGLTAGTHTITVTYSGDPGYATSTSSAVSVTVAPASTTTAATLSPATPVTGQKWSVHSVVSAVAPSTMKATGTVTVSVDGKAGKPTALTSAAAATTAMAGLKPGKHTVVVSYSGDVNHAPSTVSRTVTVAAGKVTAKVTSSAPTAKTSTLVRLTGTVKAKAPAVGTPSGSVAFYVDGHKKATRALHGCAATYSVRLAKGKHTVQVRYLGSTEFTASTSAKIKQTER